MDVLPSWFSSFCKPLTLAFDKSWHKYLRTSLLADALGSTRGGGGRSSGGAQAGEEPGRGFLARTGHRTAGSRASPRHTGEPDDQVGYSSHSVTNRSLACMSICLRRPVPEFTNLCGTPAGTTTTCPPFASITSSPAIKVTLPSCTTKTSS